MPFKSKNLELPVHLEWIREPIPLSVFMHGACLSLVFFIWVFQITHVKREIEFEVIESPKVAPLPIQVAQPKVQPRKVFKHAVFGASRRSITSQEGENVKAGNTVAKTPDHENLRADDPDALPIPSEDYLITKMPVLQAESRVPYPPGAKKRGVHGAVVMDLLIDALGHVRDVTLVDGPDPDLSSAAVAAIRNFQFSAALIQEKPVAVRIRYAYRFVLEH